jgi:23S rRNA pseudouridine2605 synthase
MMHKPRKYEVTRPHALDSEQYPGQKTVYRLLPPEFHAQGWVPVGRLDKDSTGLLLFVREGFLVGRLQRPGNLEKVYDVWVRGKVEEAHVTQALAGVPTPIGVLKAKKVTLKGGIGFKSHVEVVLDEGKNRHIRRLFAGMKEVGKPKALKVLELKRLKFGPIELDVPSAKWRFLTPDETEKLLSCIPPKPKRQ